MGGGGEFCGGLRGEGGAGQLAGAAERGARDTSASGGRVALTARIEGVPQAVAEEVEAQNGEEDRQAGRGHFD